MSRVWSVCAILFACVFGSLAVSLQDDPLVEKVKEIIDDIDDYLASNNETEIRIPNIDYSFSPIKIKNGGFGDFSTIELQDGAQVNETKQEDNSTLYSFNIQIGLQKLRFHYDFEVNTVIFKRNGNFSLSVLDNSAELVGFALVRSDSSCTAVLASLRIIKYEKFVIDLEPNDYPEAAALSEQILNYLMPFVLPISNGAFQAGLLVPRVQKAFSEFTCKKINSS